MASTAPAPPTSAAPPITATISMPPLQSHHQLLHPRAPPHSNPSTTSRAAPPSLHCHAQTQATMLPPHHPDLLFITHHHPCPSSPSHSYEHHLLFFSISSTSLSSANQLESPLTSHESPSNHRTFLHYPRPLPTAAEPTARLPHAVRETSISSM